MVRIWICIIIVIMGIMWSFASGAEPREGEEIFFRNDAGDEWYYQPDSIKRRQNEPESTKLKQALYIATAEIRGVSANPEAPIREFNQTIEINCSGRLYRIVKSEFTRKNGTSFTQHPSSDWTPAFAQTSVYIPLVDAVCKKVKQIYR